jgi:hypothetical protein
MMRQDERFAVAGIGYDADTGLIHLTEQFLLQDLIRGALCQYDGKTGLPN